MDAPHPTNGPGAASAGAAAKLGAAKKGRGNITRRKRTRSKEETLSRSLSWVLRHSAPSLGLSISSDGYIPVEDILACGHPRFRSFTVQDVRRVVETNDKQRYSLCHRRVEASGDGGREVLCIRANQGHTIASVKAEDLLTAIQPDELAGLDTIVHGTYREAWERHIRNEGLSRMQRNHIHFAPGLPTEGEETQREGTGPEEPKGVVSGMRSNCQIFVFVNGRMCAADGVRFFRSDNGVLLTAGVGGKGILPVKYFSSVLDAATGSDLLNQKE